MSKEFEGKTVLIFGASHGIGLAAAKKFQEYGADVVMLARDLDALNRRLSEMQTTDSRLTALRCDVSKYALVESCIDSLAAKGPIDFVVNSAGTIEPLAHLIDSDPSLWQNAVNTNYLGAYHITRAVAAHMRQQGHGTIIHLSSGAANSILEGWSHYCSTKAAVKKLIEVAHKELSPFGVSVVGLSPGTVATDMMKKIRDSNINVVSRLDWSTHIPAEWAAEAIAFLCGTGGEEFYGTDFSIKTDEGRRLVGLPVEEGTA